MQRIRYFIYLSAILFIAGCNISSESDANCIDVGGVWTGLYDCNGDIISLELDLIQDECSLSAVFSFSNSDLSPEIPSGSYNMEGSIRADERLTLRATTWIDRPEDWELIDLQAHLLSDKTLLRVTLCNNITVFEKS